VKWLSESRCKCYETFFFSLHRRLTKIICGLHCKRVKIVNYISSSVIYDCNYCVLYYKRDYDRNFLL
jgi:hypothetical protein